VIITSSQPNVLAVNAALPVASIKALIEYAKAHPGKLNYASVGNGSSSQLTMELLKATARIEIVHVPFNGSPPAVTATAQGDTHMLFAVMQPLQPQIQAGRLRAIAVTSAKRFPLLPDIPTIAEAGYPGFEALAWNGILVTAGTPRPIIQRLSSEINAILRDSTVKSALNVQGFDLIGGTPEDFAKLIRSESEKWAPVIRKTGADRLTSLDGDAYFIDPKETSGSIRPRRRVLNVRQRGPGITPGAASHQRRAVEVAPAPSHHFRSAPPAKLASRRAHQYSRTAMSKCQLRRISITSYSARAGGNIG
jgi:hypothetical protein